MNDPELIQYSIYTSNVYFLGIVGIIMTLVFLFQVYAMYDLMTCIFKQGDNKVIWLMLILMFPAVGALLYFLLRGLFRTSSGEHHNIL